MEATHAPRIGSVVTGAGTESFPLGAGVGSLHLTLGASAESRRKHRSIRQAMAARLHGEWDHEQAEPEGDAREGYRDA